MKKLFYYCYYRIAKAYSWWEKDYCIVGSMVLFSALAFYTLSLLAVVVYLLNKQLNLIIIKTTIIAFCAVSIFFISPKRFNKLAELYKDEKNHKLKGWLVFLFIIFSVVLYFVLLYVLDV